MSVDPAFAQKQLDSFRSRLKDSLKFQCCCCYKDLPIERVARTDVYRPKTKLIANQANGKVACYVICTTCDQLSQNVIDRNVLECLVACGFLDKLK